jgi:phage terminase large subunit
MEKTEGMQKRLAAFKKRIPVYRKSPTTFFKEILNFNPDQWQADVATDLAGHRGVSVRSGQGVGKTALEAAIALWFLSCFPFARVVCTAPTRQQLNDVLWAEISKWQSKSPILKRILKWTKTKIYVRKYEERWFATARTATKPENMQGFHEDYMLFIVDEASGVEDRIMEAILGTLSGEYNKLLMCGNPTKTSGVFFDSHNKDREDYRTHKVSCLNSPRTSKDNIAMLKRKFGEGSDVWRVRVEGEFPRGESDTFISLEMALFAKENVTVAPKGETLYIGADIARFGDDETAIYARLNGVVIDSHFHHKEGLMVTAGWLLNMAARCRQANPTISHVQIRIDDDGLGGGVTDRLNEVNDEQGLGYEIIPVRNGAASDDEYYGNKGSELWGQIKERLDGNMSKHILGLPGDLQIPDDDKLITQLTTRKWKMGSNGTIRLERKEDMKKRGLSSPDRADAFFLAFANVETESGFAFG